MEEFGFGMFCDLLDEEPQKIEDFKDEGDLRRHLEETETCIYAPLVGVDSQLHRAIRKGKKVAINALMDVYRADFDKVRDYLVAKHQWDREDKIWFEKTILVAQSEEQSLKAKSLENKLIELHDLRRAVYVLLKHPVNGDEVAVLHPSETNRSEVVELITTLIPNGFLSWNFIKEHGSDETFMQTAASKGLNHVIDRLYKYGAQIAILGHNPLLQAIRTNKQSTVQWLLTEHFDHFDCTLRDSLQKNALVAAMQLNNATLFDFVLEKMIAYRQKYYNETEEEAFNEIFKLESNGYEYTTIFSYLPKAGRTLERVEEVIKKYRLRLSYQWSSFVVLGRMIEAKVALDYCYEGIRNDPQLLGLKENESTTILHLLLNEGHYRFLYEMYAKHPDVKTYFNTDEAFVVLRKALSDQIRETIQFALEHHGDFLKSDMDKLRDQVVCLPYWKEFYEERCGLLEDCFPEFEKDIEEAMAKAPANTNYYGLEESFAKVNIKVSEVEQLPEPYSTIRGSNGETLLHWAVDKDDMELFIRMLEAGCEVDALDNDGNHPVHLVRSEAMLDLIVDRHPEGRALVHRTDNDGCSVLHKVCQQYLDNETMTVMLEKLIDYGADVHQLTSSGDSALFFARNCHVLEFLIEHGVQLEVVNKHGETALERRLCNYNVNVAIALFCKVHDLPSFKEHAHRFLAPMMRYNRDFFSGDYQTMLKERPESTRTMFDCVFQHSHEEASRLFAKTCGAAFIYVSEMFLDGGYDLDFNYDHDTYSTPLIGLLSYMEEPNIHIVKRLLERGVDVQLKDHRGRTALLEFVRGFRYFKTYQGHGLGTVQLLLEHGASVQTADEKGNTALHLAFDSGEMALVEMLIQNGADSGAVNNEGKRPFQMASPLDQELFYFYCVE